MADTSIDYIVWWGAGLSTLLALVKLGELWRDRFRIDVGYGFTGEPEIGNDIHIRNLSGKPIILAYWELFYRPHLWPLKKDSYIKSPEEDASDIRIEPHSSMTLNFSEMDHFDWGWKAMKWRRIYIRLHVAGRRPIVKRVYG
jgi:hypothetical protein